MEAVEHESGTIESCISILSRGDLLLIYPGGMRESILSDKNYNVCWREKCGFATVALESKVVCILIILLVFTRLFTKYILILLHNKFYF